MAFPPFTELGYGDQFKVRTSTQGPLYPPGTYGMQQDGSMYRYAQAGAVALTIGKLMQQPLQTTNHVLQTAAAAAVGASTVAVTLGATAVVALEYFNGSLLISTATNTGFGYVYHIDAHPAVLSGGVFTVPLAGSPSATIPTTGVRLSGSETVQVAISTQANTVSLIRNPYSLILIAATGLTQNPVGVTLAPIAANGWGWVQVRGVCAVLTDTTVVIGNNVAASSNVAGAVMPQPTSTSGGLKAIVGQVLYVGADTSYSLVNLGLG